VALLAVGEHAQHVALPIGGAGIGRGERGERGKGCPRLVEQRAATRSDAVVAPTLILQRGVGPPVGLDDQAVVQQAPDGAVERAGRQDDLAARGDLDGL